MVGSSVPIQKTSGFRSIRGGLNAVGDNASLVSVNGPASVQPGQTVTITIVMLNAGSTNWNGNYALIEAQPAPGSVSYTIKAYAQEGSVPTRQTGTYTLSFIAPTTPGSYTNYYQMQELGSGNYFGAMAGYSYSVIGPVSTSPSFDPIAWLTSTTSIAGYNIPDWLFVVAGAGAILLLSKKL
jgi:hypothetical protein